MININKNSSLVELEKLIIQSVVKQPNNTVTSEYYNPVSLFQKRYFLEKNIEETLAFNNKLVWDYTIKEVKLVSTAEELIKVYQLRSKIYGSLNYGNEFPDYIESLNFDSYDHNAAIIYNLVNNEITGTCRLIFDSKKKLPIEDKYSLDHIRDKFGSIGEVSRLMIKHKGDGLNLEFKYLTKGIYLLLTNNPIDASVSVIRKEHFKLYGRFGGFEVEKEFNEYGSLKAPFVITSWDPKQISNFFKKVFLK